MTSTGTATATHPVHVIHRIGIGVLGLFLLSFGAEGLTRRMAFMSNEGTAVMGLSTNGLLASISVVVSLVLVGAALRGGRTASSVGIVFGVLFLVSGIANMFVLGTAMNMLAFELSNVVFSLVVGMCLLFTGAYGRVSGGLAPSSPYYRDGDAPADEEESRTPAERISDAVVDRELAEAERAVALRHATPEQVEGVRRAADFRAPGDRRRAFRSV